MFDASETLFASLTKVQVNTLAAEKLYLLAGEWARLGPDTLLFDICCGTGTIGLTLARQVGMVWFKHLSSAILFEDIMLLGLIKF